MIIKRKLYSIPLGPLPAAQNKRVRDNGKRWKEFNKETTGKRGTFRINAGETRKEFESWQKDKYGNVVEV